MLIRSPRHTARDLDAWERFEKTARAHADLKQHKKRVERSRDAISSFVKEPCYAGVSWGKDSVCLAHLVVMQAPEVPLVWVRVEPDYNPDCLLVRDEFLRLYPQARYDEIVVHRRDLEKDRAHGSLDAGMRQAAERHSDRYLSGIRAEESGARRRRMRAFGEATARTAAPLGWWTGWDVFGYLLMCGLPIHPAYACTLGGMLDPLRIRVSPLGRRRGDRPGDGVGRAEWEERYFREDLRRLGF